MDSLFIKGGRRLVGTIPITGAKNAALPIMAASILSPEPLRLTNVPRLADIDTMAAMLSHLGVQIDADHDHATMQLQARTLSTKAPYHLVRKMRASILLLGALLARCGEAKVSLPGGCAIGARPVNLHLQALRQLSATIVLENGYIVARAPRHGLRGNRIVLDKPSVGASENAILAACLSKGESEIINCAREPEIIDLAQCLKSMGARIEGAGTGTIRIEGKDRLHGASHNIMADRIEAGSYLLATAACGGSVRLTDFDVSLLGDTTRDIFAHIGIVPKQIANTLCFDGDPQELRRCNITTAPFPGFPTDLQAQTMTVLCLAKGESRITETIFENRFLHAAELQRMGARIAIRHNTADIDGGRHLRGAQVMASDLRASFSLVIAGLCAEGETTIHRIYHIDRGYASLQRKLGLLGADLRRGSPDT